MLTEEGPLDHSQRPTSTTFDSSNKQQWKRRRSDSSTIPDLAQRRKEHKPLPSSILPPSSSNEGDRGATQMSFIPWPSILTPVNPIQGPRSFPDWILEDEDYSTPSSSSSSTPTIDTIDNVDKQQATEDALLLDDSELAPKQQLVMSVTAPTVAAPTVTVTATSLTTITNDRSNENRVIINSDVESLIDFDSLPLADSVASTTPQTLVKDSIDTVITISDDEDDMDDSNSNSNKTRIRAGDIVWEGIQIGDNLDMDDLLGGSTSPTQRSQKTTAHQLVLPKRKFINSNSSNYSPSLVSTKKYKTTTSPPTQEHDWAIMTIDTIASEDTDFDIDLTGADTPPSTTLNMTATPQTSLLLPPPTIATEHVTTATSSPPVTAAKVIATKQTTASIPVDITANATVRSSPSSATLIPPTIKSAPFPLSKTTTTKGPTSSLPAAAAAKTMVAEQTTAPLPSDVTTRLSPSSATLIPPTIKSAPFPLSKTTTTTAKGPTSSPPAAAAAKVIVTEQTTASSPSDVTTRLSSSTIKSAPFPLSKMTTTRTGKTTSTTTDPPPPPQPLQHTPDITPVATNTSIDSHTIPDEELPLIAINEMTKDETPIYIHPHFVRSLKKHQIEGIQFMWSQLIGESNGCVLAHCMGLGKTLQVVVVVTTLFIEIGNGNPAIPLDIAPKRILVLAPLITLTNWMNEFDRWVPPDMASNISHIFKSSDLLGVKEDRRVQYIRRWYNDGGIMLMNYDQFRHLLASSNRRSEFEVMLLKPSLVVLDEAHRIKNPLASVTKCVNKIQTPRRICLTGYPLQNNLAEYYCMIDFIYPGLFGEEKAFRTTFQKPIEAVYADSTTSERYLAQSQLLTLQLLTKDLIHRKDATILNNELPGKTEYFVSCRLTAIQYRIYIKLLKKNSVYHEFLLAMMMLRALCNHPAVLKKMLLKNSDKKSGTAALTDDTAEVNDQDECAIVEKFAAKDLRDWSSFNTDTSDIEAWESSHKIRMVLAICKQCKEESEKVIIVSHSLVNLDYIQSMLASNDFAVSRIDGATPQGERQPIIDQFNEDDTFDVMLLSAKAGAIGVNITSACRMILADTDWNPSHDEQSIGRIYRFGQKKHVYIYRLLTYSTVESCVMALGAHKRSIAKRVVDNKLSKLQIRSDLHRYFRKPKEDPSCKINASTLDKIGDPVLKACILAERNSVVKVEIHGQQAGQEDAISLTRAEIDEEQYPKIRRYALDMLKNAKTRHHHTFNSFFPDLD